MLKIFICIFKYIIIYIKIPFHKCIRIALKSFHLDAFNFDDFGLSDFTCELMAKSILTVVESPYVLTQRLSKSRLFYDTGGH